MFKHNEQPTTRSWRKLVAIVIPVVLLFVGASYFAVNQWYTNNLKAVSESASAEDITVVIESGTSLRDIAAQLEEDGLIRSATVFTWYAERTSEINGELQAGTYELNPSQNTRRIAAILAEGEVATNLYTILPGMRLDELEQKFIESGYSAEDTSAALSARYEHPLFESVPLNATLEGYVFPETYRISVDSTPRAIVTASFDEFLEQLTPEILDGIAKQGLTLHEAITLASIVEKESSNIVDQPKVAQVFLKRLNEDIILGSDVTFFYASAVTGERASPELDSPYNTRIYGGLPPGPISNFNIDALKAVASPADTDWLYFVAGDDGVTYFSKIQAEHDALTNEHCFELCKLPE